MVRHPAQQPSLTVRDSKLVAHPARSATEQEEVNAGDSENIVEVNESPLPPVEVDNQDERLDYEVVISRTNKEAIAINSQIAVNKFKDEDQCGKEHSFEKPHGEKAPDIEREEAKIGLTEWVKNTKLTSCLYVKKEPERSGSMEIAIIGGRLQRVANILFFQPGSMDGGCRGREEDGFLE